mgnify:CR=1 FL=1
MKEKVHKKDDTILREREKFCGEIDKIEWGGYNENELK